MMDANEAILALAKEPRKRVGLIQERFAQEFAGALSTVNHSENGNHPPHRFLLRRFLELRE
jgi:DNA-binding XRE family transcriptional regulator